MTSETIAHANQDGVARITLNRPDRLNSFTAQMHEELASALDAADDDPAVRAIWLTGAGRGFCAGQDLNDRAVAPGSEPMDLGETVEKYWAPLVERLARRDKPVVCAVNGVAAGAGANVALACDIVFAARSAKFIQSFANIGLIPDTGGTWVLPRVIGQARAIGLALTAEPLSAKKAEEWGMIWKCVDDESLESESLALAKRLAAGPTRGLAATKHALRGAFQQDLSSELAHECDLMRELGFSDDYREGVSAFMEKRKPEFSGR
ncbi:2-(1,2-epoxy-1,2-dihydrophenyl)acetyl-CoA isomerase PaaG [Novosphingobium pentaromativorans]|uniref:Phenylacetate degradation, enoyl-CoA hydratase paaB n=1 Tax=Novosphingobium pentaromativorans US6-1 TaxID=1088721 RepID=G6EHI6_9SPHN|nr:2-(1,2-epoxy-1,2-dihydrophenyl)acetyl-CoA isomerase PaaG [Novosphingobium pentaromativorans]AIT81863.1 enoyl-CoA hydratase [Novosphingobium pentaromativorans US6-1]EHJ59475.1 phenylacetate degradation, enoyl-CoA hydratase paaB [Novosphingobium pentaromativorans US6-1]